jgi:hypothetical protein
VICLTDGVYSAVSLKASKPVTLRAAHPGQATIGATTLAGNDLTLARFEIDGEVSVVPGSNRITISHNRITGGYMGVNACPSSSTTCDDEAIIGNQFVGPFGEDAIRANRYHDGNGDGVGLLVEGNEFTGVRENGNHSDCLQAVWVGDHLVYRKNYLHDNRCQGFFVKDQASAVNGITVDDNLFLRNHEACGAPATSCGQPSYFQVFGPYTGLKVTHNTIWGDGSDSLATFQEGTGPDTQITGNVIYRFWTSTSMAAATFSENTLCSLEAASGGSWPSSRPGTTTSCSLSFPNTKADDYRLGNGRGVDWTPAEQHYGP